MTTAPDWRARISRLRDALHAAMKRQPRDEKHIRYLRGRLEAMGAPAPKEIQR